MKRRQFLTGLALLSASAWLGCTPSEKKSATSSLVKVSETDGYWTCTMHPQVHQDGPGKCPICGMPLVHVNGHQQMQKQEPEALDVSNSQLQNAQVSRFTVTKSDLEMSIPVSGRMISTQEVALQIYETDLASVKAGFSFSGSPAMAPGQIFQGQVIQIDNLIDPSSRTVRAIGRLKTSAPRLSQDSAFHGEITNTLKDVIVIPEEAVLHAGTRELVYVFSSENKLQSRKVELGAKGKTGYQILSGLKPGEIISSGPNFLLDSEAKLRGL